MKCSHHQRVEQDLMFEFLNAQNLLEHIVQLFLR